VTPDSFSDGGDYLTDFSKVLTTVKSWVDRGAVDIVDIGGESTRPGWFFSKFVALLIQLPLGAQPVSEEEEIRRVVPIITVLRQESWFEKTLISIDTSKSKVAEAAIKAGANIINDVTAGN